MDTYTLRELVKTATNRVCGQVESAQRQANVRLVGFEVKMIRRKFEPADKENGPSGRLESEQAVVATAKLQMVIRACVGESELVKQI